MAISLKRALIGSPIATARAAHERLTKIVALPVFASDAVSSSAYATEAILLALLLEHGGGMNKLAAVLPIAIGIAVLLAIVSISYRQTVLAYPTGGGSYIVARENLGIRWATIAGASLLIDYVLTVSVSVSAGIAAITSAFVFLRPYTVLLCMLAVALIAWANLRGVRESGLLFSIPTYSFIVSMLITIGWGLWQVSVTGVHPTTTAALSPLPALGAIPIFLALHAFASGCTALTGVEAISNGVQAFKPLEGRNAAVTMIWMALTLGVLFLGITYLAFALYIVPSATAAEGSGGETVVSMITAAVWGGKNSYYYVVQFATMAILVVAANTSFADFPRLSAILARDRFLPRQFANVGDRLVYNNGIIILAIVSAILIALLRGNVNGLLPLYAIGVFLSFTISQSGMVRHWQRLRTPGWSRSAVVNGVGAFVTLIVLLVLAITKFWPPEANVMFTLPFSLPLIGTKVRAGAWLVVLLIPSMVGTFYKIHKHYQTVSSQLTLIGLEKPRPTLYTAIVLVPSINRGILPALMYAKSLGQDARAVHIEMDPSDTQRLRKEWEEWEPNIPLLVLESPYRSLIEPLFRYLDEVQTEREHLVTLIIPEFVPLKWWHKLLHNQSGFMLKVAMLFRKDVVVTNVRYHLKE